MRKLPTESLEEWAERVHQFELKYALNEIKNGADINVVMEAMSVRIQKKILHPFYEEIKQVSYNSSKDLAELSRKRYEEQYLSKNKPKPDHILEDK
jgi:glutamyl-tRNA reductase